MYSRSSGLPVTSIGPRERMEIPPTGPGPSPLSRGGRCPRRPARCRGPEIKPRACGGGAAKPTACRWRLPDGGANDPNALSIAWKASSRSGRRKKPGLARRRRETRLRSPIVLQGYGAGDFSVSISLFEYPTLCLAVQAWLIQDRVAADVRRRIPAPNEFPPPYVGGYRALAAFLNQPWTLAQPFHRFL